MPNTQRHLSAAVDVDYSPTDRSASQQQRGLLALGEFLQERRPGCRVRITAGVDSRQGGLYVSQLVIEQDGKTETYEAGDGGYSHYVLPSCAQFVVSYLNREEPTGPPRKDAVSPREVHRLNRLRLLTGLHWFRELKDEQDELTAARQQEQSSVPGPPDIPYPSCTE